MAASIDPLQATLSDSEAKHKNGTVDLEPPSALDEARKTYTHIIMNEYKSGAKGMIPDAAEMMPCVCKYAHGRDDPSAACGEGSDCINRALLIECTDEDCPCGVYCQNRRFQKCDYAPMEIIKTNKKGYGLRALAPIKANQFVIEYCGEVIPQHVFIKRAKDYAAEGVKHFYFMSLMSGEIVDAQKKGNWARFMNHSCNPNCILQKWVVGNRFRMGLFAKRDIETGQELTFDYKFERYGDKAQPCYCGESVCTGFIGGSKKTELNDEEDEEEEMYLSDGEPKKKKEPKEKPKEATPLTSVEDVQKLVKIMLYSSSKPGKIEYCLQTLELTTEKSMRRKFLQYHGLLVLKSCLSRLFKTDISLSYRILVLLKNMPIGSRNSIIDCKIEDYIIKCTDVNEVETALTAKEILEQWATLPVLYKIPKRNASDSKQGSATSLVLETESQDPTPDNESNQTVDVTNSPFSIYSNDSGFRGRYASRPDTKSNASSSHYRQLKYSVESDRPLPKDWKLYYTDSGDTYYYNEHTGVTQWEFPVGSTEVFLETTNQEKRSHDSTEEIDKPDTTEDMDVDPSGKISKELRANISHVIIKTLSQYKDQFSVEKFKKLARKYTHTLIDKESRSQTPIIEMTEDMKYKIKKYVTSKLKDMGIQNVQEPKRKKQKQ